MTRPLFGRYPQLADRLPHVELGSFPTPVRRVSIGGTDVWVKRDDLSAEPYGGNKVRKLEFLLGAALAEGAIETLTFGAAGSNHALATAIHARRLGLGPISFLGAQPNARYVGRNLLAHLGAGADIRYFDDLGGWDREVVRVLQERERETGRRPYVVPMGGTSPLGALGFVDAALELGGQCEAGDAPAPDRIYVPLGSMGTAAGLIVGAHIAGLTSRVIAVRVTPHELANEENLAALVDGTVRFLREAGAAVDDVPGAAWEVRHDVFGEEYARFTPEGMDAVRAAKEAGVVLEGTYTGKTMAALLADARGGALEGRTALFWDTYDSHDVTRLGEGRDYRSLPAGCHAYFTEPVQELDV